jgi:cytochrome P450
MNLFSDQYRRNPYPLYEQMRTRAPVYHDPQSGLWMLFDYASVKQALHNRERFSSRLGPVEWMIFLDPPRHTKLRALVSQAFTPRSVANPEPRIRELCHSLQLASTDPWEPRKGLHVHGPSRLPIQFQPSRLASA